jgi:hypothetical protein
MNPLGGYRTYFLLRGTFHVNQATETRAGRVLGGMKGLASGQGPGCRAGL